MQRDLRTPQHSVLGEVTLFTLGNLLVIADRFSIIQFKIDPEVPDQYIHAAVEGKIPTLRRHLGKRRSVSTIKLLCKLRVKRTTLN